MPEISIIVPVYKAEDYLHQCVDSILSQTFNDFELILVNDGSPDNCGRLCEEYREKDSRIRVIHQENQGQSAARNNALPLTPGRWLCSVDSDDAIHPRMLELLAECRRVRKILPRLRVGAKCFQSRVDEMVSMASCKQLKANPAVELTVLEHSGHFAYGEPDVALLCREFGATVAQMCRE